MWQKISFYGTPHVLLELGWRLKSLLRNGYVHSSPTQPTPWCGIVWVFYICSSRSIWYHILTGNMTSMSCLDLWLLTKFGQWEERSDDQRWRENETAVRGLLAVSVPSFRGLVLTLHSESQLLVVVIYRQTFSQGAGTAPRHCSDWDVITADCCSWPGILQLSLLVPLNLPNSVHFSQSCLTLCDPMDCSTPGLPVHHQLSIYSNSCPSSRWCNPTISSSVILFSFHLQSIPATGSFQMSQFFTSGRQSIGVSVSASVLPMNIQDWFPLGWTGWIFLQSKGLLRVFSNTTIQKHQFFSTQLSL